MENHAKELYGGCIKISLAMTESPAWKALSGNQRALYLECLMQLFAQECPGKDYPSKEEYQNAFYMDWKNIKASEIYKSRAAFRKDMQKLVETGFLDCLRKMNVGWLKSIYGYSNRWKDYEGEFE